MVSNFVTYRVSTSILSYKISVTSNLSFNKDITFIFKGFSILAYKRWARKSRKHKKKNDHAEAPGRDFTKDHTNNTKKTSKVERKEVIF